jgi:hypothetical protein
MHTSCVNSSIVLASDACFRPPITYTSQDLHARDIRKSVGEIASYYERD